MNTTMIVRTVLLVGLILYPVPVWSSETWDAATREAVLRGDWAKVAAAGEHWKQRDPTEATADWLYAYASLATNRYNAATQAFSRLDTATKVQGMFEHALSLVNQNPKSAIAQMLLGDALARKGDYTGAIGSLDKAVQLAPRSALAREVRGVVRGLAGQTHESAADLNKAISLNPRCACAHADLGLMRLADQDLVGAVDALTQAVEIAPEFAIAYNGRGVAYSVMEAWDEAESDFQKAVHLAPSLSSARGNLLFTAWAKGQVAFRQSLRSERGDSRGSTLISQSYDRRAVDIGGGRTMDVFILKATPQTATLDGMQAVVRDITSRLRSENALPDSWQPRIHVDAHGWNSTPYAQLDYAAVMGQRANADAVVALDLSSWYRWQNTSTWSSNVTEAAGQTARAAAAIHIETGFKPSYTGNSGGAEVIPRLGEMLTHGDLPPPVASNLGFSTVLLTGYPFQERTGKDVSVSASLIGKIDGRIYNLHTTPGSWSNTLATSDKVTNVLVTDFGGQGVAHWDWTHPTLRGRENPVFDIGGAALRGWDPPTVQQMADRLGRLGQVPMYATPADQPVGNAFLMATMVARGLRMGDKVLIGTVDADRAKVLSRPFATGGWQTEWKPVIDPAALQNLATAGHYSEVLYDKSGPLDNLSSALLSDAQGLPALSLPSLRPLAQNIDRFNDAVGLLYKLADKEVPAGLKVPLAFAGPAIQDAQAGRAGQFNPWMSQTLERAGQFGLGELPQLTANLVKQGKLPANYNNLSPFLAGLPDIVAAGASQVGRGQLAPTVDEVTHYLDGINKASWAVVGGLVGGPKGADIAATAGGLTADVIRGATEPLFRQWAQEPVRREVIENFRAEVATAGAYGLPAKTLSEMFTPQYLDQIGIRQNTVAELDNYARWANSTRTLQSAPLQNLQMPIPVGIVPTQEDSWKKPSIGSFPPFKFDAAAVAPSTYRLPSAALPEDKRGGVAMKTDVVKGAPADTSEMFGGRANEAPKVTSAASYEQNGLWSPPLLFCALVTP